MKISKAVILSAGFGRRLNPLTLSTPKPLLKVGSKTLLSNTIEIAEKIGVKEIIINTHHLAKKIESFIKQKNFKVKIIIKNEKDNILDTGGGILNAISQIQDNHFFVLNPDTLWSIKYLNEFKNMENIFFNNHCEGVLLIVNKKRSFDKSFKGDFNLDDKIVSRDKKSKDYIYTGAQILTKKAFKKYFVSTFSVNKIWDDLISNKLLLGAESKQDFFHIGTLKNFQEISKKYF